MAYSDALSAEAGANMCKENRHHWHMTSETDIKCCRCGETGTVTAKTVSEGPHDDAGDVAE